MKNKKILLSVITPTLNAQVHMKKFLNSIKKQNIEGFSLEIVVVDGGSIDDTVKMAKKIGARIIKNPHVLADPGVNIGIQSARGDLLMVLAVDNIFEDKDSFKKIVHVFKNNDITAAFPMHESSKKDSLYTKYINVFTDPFNHFVYGNAANGRTFNKAYKSIESNDIYDVYDYLSNKDRPLIAVAQGFTVRKGFTKKRNSAFDDILPVTELIIKKKKIAYAHSVKLYHHTVRDLDHFMRKQAWATVNALQGRKYGIAHRIDYLSDNQKLKTKIWPFYAFSILLPIIRSLYGLVWDREPMWIFHPFLCIISAYSSLVAGIKFTLDKSYIPGRQ